MIDNKKIEEAALGYCAKCSDIINRNVDSDEDECVDLYNGFIDGAKWAIDEFIKDLWHPSSEEPKNLEYIVFTTTMFGEVYLFTKQVDNTQDWKTIVETHGIKQWIYRDDIVSLIFKEVKE